MPGPPASPRQQHQPLPSRRRPVGWWWWWGADTANVIRSNPMRSPKNRCGVWPMLAITAHPLCTNLCQSASYQLSSYKHTRDTADRGCASSAMLPPNVAQPPGRWVSTAALKHRAVVTYIHQPLVHHAVPAVLPDGNVTGCRGADGLHLEGVGTHPFSHFRCRNTPCPVWVVEVVCTCVFASRKSLAALS